MPPIRIVAVSCLSLMIAMPATVRAEEAPATGSLITREFHVEHVDVKEANGIVRSILNPRKAAVDERRQVIILTDTPENLDKVAALLATVDGAVPEWSVSLVALSGVRETVLRTATITQGRLEVQFGPPPATTQDSLGVTATIKRAASSEVDLEWTASLTMTLPWTESAHALETLHEGATVTLLRTPDHARQNALAHLMGIPDDVDSLIIRVMKRAN